MSGNFLKFYHLWDYGFTMERLFLGITQVDAEPFTNTFRSIKTATVSASVMCVVLNSIFPRLQESQILQNSSEILVSFAFLARILQVCTRITNFAKLLQCRTFLTRF